MTGLMIRDPATGRAARVSESGLETRSVSLSIQHNVSISDGQAYSISASIGNTGLGVQNVLYIRNESVRSDLVVSSVSVQTLTLAGGIVTPSENEFWVIGATSEEAVGGTPVDAVQMNRGAGNSLAASVTSDGFSLAEAPQELFRHYVSDSGRVFLGLEEALILPVASALVLQYNTGSLASFVNCSASVFMLEKER